MAKAPEFSYHARKRMIERNITERQVWLTVNNPDRIAPGIDGATNYYREIDGRTIRVTVGSSAWDVRRRIIVTVA
jgi:hypothetical protein